MNEIKAIETEYAGCRFRSRLEARWGVFFDTLGVRWAYEAQGYALNSGWYLPDFQLFGLGGDGERHEYIWFEVKPENGTDDDPRWLDLSAQAPVVVAFGMWDGRDHPDADSMVLYEDEGWDNSRAFCYCGTCGQLGIAFSGLATRVCRAHRNRGFDSYSHDDDRILNAYRAARSARFEHGERG